MEGGRRNGTAVRDIIEHNELGFPGVVTETSMTLPDDLDIDRWLEVGMTLKRMESAMPWWVGDFMLFGIAKFGEMASQMDDEFEYQYLADCKWVAGKIPSSRRHENVKWSHHREVAALEPETADEILQQADEERWPRSTVRAAVKALKLPARLEPKIDLECMCRCRQSDFCPDCGHPWGD
jgi:hypothetical protein